MARGLSVELIPTPLWGRSLANLARKGWGPQWEAIRLKEFSKTSGKCEFCSGPGVILHEHWEYDDSRNVQRLSVFSVTCDRCSLVHHFGRAGKMGRENEALWHMMQVIRISQAEAESLVEQAFDDWERRSMCTWIQDFGWLRSRVWEYGLSEHDIAKAEQLLSHSS